MCVSLYPVRYYYLLTAVLHVCEWIMLCKWFAECSWFLQKLHEEVRTTQQAGFRDRNSPSLSPRMEAVIMSHFDKLLVKHQQQHMALLEELLLQRQEALMSAISQAVGNLVTAKLEDIVTAEIKNSIIPGRQLSTTVNWMVASVSDTWTSNTALDFWVTHTHCETGTGHHYTHITVGVYQRSIVFTVRREIMSCR